ncbi:MAG: type II secretion system F family protein [Candidatus Berkelbacteria bacterium]|nr:type II secretion system F family protein [Candidatus Berkelbacteria bacterium]
MQYQYKAKDQQGALRKGAIDAKNPQDIYEELKKQGLVLLSYEEKESNHPINLPFINKVSLKSLAIFTKELQVMIKAGLSLSAALKAQGEQSENKTLKQVALKLSKEVEGGTPLSEAMSKFPAVFSPFYINTVKSGERSGALEEVFMSLTEQIEKDYDLQSKIKGAMIYPAFILAALVVVLILILIYVVPSLTKLFKELGGTLPITTRIMISSSNFARSYWWVIILGLFALYYALKLMRKTKNGAHILDQLKIRVPIFGSLVRKIYMARFCRTSSTLIKAGLPLIQVLETAQTVVSNTIYQEELEKIKKKVENGLPLSTSIKGNEYFPVMIHQLISVGESTGKLEESLDTLAEFYEKEVTNTTAALASLIEPVLIIIIGMAVALVVISVIKPIYGITDML